MEEEDVFSLLTNNPDAPPGEGDKTDAKTTGDDRLEDPLEGIFPEDRFLLSFLGEEPLDEDYNALTDQSSLLTFRNEDPLPLEWDPDAPPVLALDAAGGLPSREVAVEFCYFAVALGLVHSERAEIRDSISMHQLVVQMEEQIKQVLGGDADKVETFRNDNTPTCIVLSALPTDGTDEWIHTVVEHINPQLVGGEDDKYVETWDPASAAFNARSDQTLFTFLHNDNLSRRRIWWSPNGRLPDWLASTPVPRALPNQPQVLIAAHSGWFPYLMTRATASHGTGHPASAWVSDWNASAPVFLTHEDPDGAILAWWLYASSPLPWVGAEVKTEGVDAMEFTVFVSNDPWATVAEMERTARPASTATLSRAIEHSIRSLRHWADVHEVRGLRVALQRTRTNPGEEWYDPNRSDLAVVDVWLHVTLVQRSVPGGAPRTVWWSITNGVLEPPRAADDDETVDRALPACVRENEFPNVQSPFHTIVVPEEPRSASACAVGTLNGMRATVTSAFEEQPPSRFRYLPWATFLYRQDGNAPTSMKQRKTWVSSDLAHAQVYLGEAERRVSALALQPLQSFPCRELKVAVPTDAGMPEPTEPRRPTAEQRLVAHSTDSTELRNNLLHNSAVVLSDNHILSVLHSRYWTVVLSTNSAGATIMEEAREGVVTIRVTLLPAWLPWPVAHLNTERSVFSCQLPFPTLNKRTAQGDVVPHRLCAAWTIGRDRSTGAALREWLLEVGMQNHDQIFRLQVPVRCQALEWICDRPGAPLEHTLFEKMQTNRCVDWYIRCPFRDGALRHMYVRVAPGRVPEFGVLDRDKDAEAPDACWTMWLFAVAIRMRLAAVIIWMDIKERGTLFDSLLCHSSTRAHIMEPSLQNAATSEVRIVQVTAVTPTGNEQKGARAWITAARMVRAVRWVWLLARAALCRTRKEMEDLFQHDRSMPNQTVTSLVHFLSVLLLSDGHDPKRADVVLAFEPAAPSGFQPKGQPPTPVVLRNPCDYAPNVVQLCLHRSLARTGTDEFQRVLDLAPAAWIARDEHGTARAEDMDAEAPNDPMPRRHVRWHQEVASLLLSTFSEPCLLQWGRVLFPVNSGAHAGNIERDAVSDVLQLRMIVPEGVPWTITWTKKAAPKKKHALETRKGRALPWDDQRLADYGSPPLQPDVSRSNINDKDPTVAEANEDRRIAFPKGPEMDEADETERKALPATPIGMFAVADLSVLRDAAVRAIAEYAANDPTPSDTTDGVPDVWCIGLFDGRPILTASAQAAVDREVNSDVGVGISQMQSWNTISRDRTAESGVWLLVGLEKYYSSTVRTVNANHVQRNLHCVGSNADAMAFVDKVVNLAYECSSFYVTDMRGLLWQRVFYLFLFFFLNAVRLGRTAHKSTDQLLLPELLFVTKPSADSPFDIRWHKRFQNTMRHILSDLASGKPVRKASDATTEFLTEAARHVSNHHEKDDSAFLPAMDGYLFDTSNVADREFCENIKKVPIPVDSDVVAEQKLPVSGAYTPNLSSTKGVAMNDTTIGAANQFLSFTIRIPTFVPKITLSSLPTVSDLVVFQCVLEGKTPDAMGPLDVQTLWTDLNKAIIPKDPEEDYANIIRMAVRQGFIGVGVWGVFPRVMFSSVTTTWDKRLAALPDPLFRIVCGPKGDKARLLFGGPPAATMCSWTKDTRGTQLRRANNQLDRLTSQLGVALAATTVMAAVSRAIMAMAEGRHQCRPVYINSDKAYGALRCARIVTRSLAMAWQPQVSHFVAFLSSNTDGMPFAHPGTFGVQSTDMIRVNRFLQNVIANEELRAMALLVPEVGDIVDSQRTWFALQSSEVILSMLADDNKSAGLVAGIAPYWPGDGPHTSVDVHPAQLAPVLFSERFRSAVYHLGRNVHFRARAEQLIKECAMAGAAAAHAPAAVPAEPKAVAGAQMPRKAVTALGKAGVNRNDNSHASGGDEAEPSDVVGIRNTGVTCFVATGLQFVSRAIYDLFTEDEATRLAFLDLEKGQSPPVGDDADAAYFVVRQCAWRLCSALRVAVRTENRAVMQQATADIYQLLAHARPANKYFKRVEDIAPAYDVAALTGERARTPMHDTVGVFSARVTACTVCGRITHETVSGRVPHPLFYPQITISPPATNLARVSRQDQVDTSRRLGDVLCETAPAYLPEYRCKDCNHPSTTIILKEELIFRPRFFWQNASNNARDALHFDRIAQYGLQVPQWKAGPALEDESSIPYLKYDALAAAIRIANHWYAVIRSDAPKTKDRWYEVNDGHHGRLNMEGLKDTANGFSNVAFRAADHAQWVQSPPATLDELCAAWAPGSSLSRSAGIAMITLPVRARGVLRWNQWKASGDWNAAARFLVVVHDVDDNTRLLITMARTAKNGIIVTPHVYRFGFELDPTRQEKVYPPVDVPEQFHAETKTNGMEISVLHDTQEYPISHPRAKEAVPFRFVRLLADYWPWWVQDTTDNPNHLFDRSLPPRLELAPLDESAAIAVENSEYRRFRMYRNNASSGKHDIAKSAWDAKPVSVAAADMARKDDRREWDPERGGVNSDHVHVHLEQ